jgi:hypothetical protein
MSGKEITLMRKKQQKNGGGRTEGIENLEASSSLSRRGTLSPLYWPTHFLSREVSNAPASQFSMGKYVEMKTKDEPKKRGTVNGEFNPSE